MPSIFRPGSLHASHLYWLDLQYRSEPHGHPGLPSKPSVGWRYLRLLRTPYRQWQTGPEASSCNSPLETEMWQCLQRPEALRAQTVEMVDSLTSPLRNLPICYSSW